MSESDLEKVLFTKDDIDEIVTRVAKEIDDVYYTTITQSQEKKRLVLIGILKGSYVFLSDLSRKLNTPHVIEFMSVKSYSDTKSTGTVQILTDLRDSITNDHAIVVEDILDTGLTLNYLLKLIGEKNPESLEVCTLLRKPTQAKVQVHVKFLGVDIDPEFVIGYGLDYNEYFRNLDCIGVPTNQTIENYSLSKR